MDHQQLFGVSIKSPFKLILLNPNVIKIEKTLKKPKKKAEKAQKIWQSAMSGSETYICELTIAKQVLLQRWSKVVHFFVK